MSRLFDGIDDQIEWSIGGCSVTTGAVTLVALLKFDAGVSWQGIFGNDITATGSEVAMARHTDGRLMMYRGGGAGGSAGGSITISSADGWCIYALSKPAGTSAVTSIKHPIGGSVSTSTSAGTLGTFLAQDKVVFGHIDGADWFDGRVAALAQYHAALTSTDIQGLAGTLTRANWLSLSPVGLWDADDVFVTDHTGNGASRTSITGTAADGDDPAGWASWGAAPADNTTKVGPAGWFSPLLNPKGWF